jgi:hypothetical protein
MEWRSTWPQPAKAHGSRTSRCPSGRSEGPEGSGGAAAPPSPSPLMLKPRRISPAPMADDAPDGPGSDRCAVGTVDRSRPGGSGSANAGAIEPSYAVTISPRGARPLPPLLPIEVRAVARPLPAPAPADGDEEALPPALPPLSSNDPRDPDDDIAVEGGRGAATQEAAAAVALVSHSSLHHHRR